MSKTNIQAQAELAFAIYHDFSHIINNIEQNLERIKDNDIYKGNILKELTTAKIILKQLQSFSAHNSAAKRPADI